MERPKLGSIVFSTFDHRCEGGTVVEIFEAANSFTCVAVVHSRNDFKEIFWYALSNIFSTHEEALRSYQRRMARATEGQGVAGSQPVSDESYIGERRALKQRGQRKTR